MLERLVGLVRKGLENPRVVAARERLDGGGLDMKTALKRNLKAAGVDLKTVHIPTPAELKRAEEAGRLEAFLQESGFTEKHGGFQLRGNAPRREFAEIRVTPKPDAGFHVAYRARVNPQDRYGTPPYDLMQDTWLIDGKLTGLGLRRV
jgi:hypothetical protein